MDGEISLDDLDEAQVRALIAGGETLTVEFKEESRKPFNDRSLVETVACLANGEGGYLLVGVTDDGTVTGARPRHEAGRTDPVRVEALIANNTVPPVAAQARVVALDEHEVLVIRVENSPRVIGTTSGVYLRRARGGVGARAAYPSTRTRCSHTRSTEAPPTTLPSGYPRLPSTTSIRWSSSGSAGLSGRPDRAGTTF